MPSLPISTLKENQHQYSSLSHPSYQKRLWAKQSKWLKANLVNEIWNKEQLSKTMWCGPKKVVLFGSVEMVFSTGRSIHDAPERGLLRKMRMEEGSVHALGLFALLLRDFCWLFLSRNANASVPSTIIDSTLEGERASHSLSLLQMNLAKQLCRQPMSISERDELFLLFRVTFFRHLNALSGSVTSVNNGMSSLYSYIHTTLSNVMISGLRKVLLSVPPL